MVKAIFFDVDGTLVSFKTHRMSDRLKETLRILQGKGVKLFVSTGRTLLAIDNIEDYPFDGFITMNGVLTTLGGEVIDAHPLPEEVTAKVAQICERHSIPCWVFADTMIGINFEDDRTREVAAQLQLYPPRYLDLAQTAREHVVYQYTIFVSQEQQDTLLQPALPGVEYPRWHPYFSDIVPAGLNKSYGMKCILDRLGLKREDCMAFGDGGNDIPMLEYAGTGIAMGNAADDVKAAADYVTDSVDNDGIVTALLRYGVLQET